MSDKYKYQNRDRVLFKAGIKPALLTTNNIRKRYFENKQYVIRDENCIIFNNEKDHIAFINNKTFDTARWSDYKVGIVLGYPLQAISDYIQHKKQSTDGRRDVHPDEMSSVYYHGFIFHCKTSNIDTCIQWMKKVYVIPEELKTEISTHPLKQNKKLPCEVRQIIEYKNKRKRW